MGDGHLQATIARFGPAVFFTAVALFYAARIVLLRRRLGHSPVTYGARGTENFRLSLTFRVFRVLIWLAAVARSVLPPFDVWLMPLPTLYEPDLMVAGNLVMVLAFLRVGWLNFHMGRSWRSGVAPSADPAPLLTGGAFARCRHPMLAAVMVGQVGLFLAIPTVFTLLCLVVGLATLVRQAELEELDLARRHGDRWSAYRSATRKWPWSAPVSRLSGRAHA